MYELKVSGQMEAVGLVDGSSGRFLGDIEGLYEGYRIGNPREQFGVLQAANGTIALILKHESPITRQRGENPFKDGKDPLASPSPGGTHPPPSVSAEGNPSGGPPGGRPPFKKMRQVKLLVDGEKSTGIYARATGEMTIDASVHKESGHLIVATKHGDLLLNFREWPEEGKLVAECSVDGEKSTRIYRNARGDLKFALSMFGGSVAKGPYSGTIYLQQEPAKIWNAMRFSSPWSLSTAIIFAYWLVVQSGSFAAATEATFGKTTNERPLINSESLVFERLANVLNRDPLLHGAWVFKEKLEPDPQTPASRYVLGIIVDKSQASHQEAIVQKVLESIQFDHPYRIGAVTQLPLSVPHRCIAASGYAEVAACRVGMRYRRTTLKRIVIGPSRRSRIPCRCVAVTCVAKIFSGFH
jgi:hypothetical protein